jgi:hypothetical protein
LIRVCLNILKVEKLLQLTDEYISSKNEYMDLREIIHPKKKSEFGHQSYMQVFLEKFPFTPNLSIIDLLFNTGPVSLSILSQVK